MGKQNPTAEKMLPFEYPRTSFSYVDRETQEERYVAVPEEGGRDLIPQDPPAPGVVYTAAVGGHERKAGIYRLEVSVGNGTGKLKPSGGIDKDLKESCIRAFSFMQTHKGELGLGRDLDSDRRARSIREGPEVAVDQARHHAQHHCPPRNGYQWLAIKTRTAHSRRNHDFKISQHD